MVTSERHRGTTDERAATLRPILTHLLAAAALVLFVLLPLSAGPTLLLGGAITLWAMGSFAAEHPDG